MLDRNSMLSFLKEYHWIKGELWVNFDYVNQLSKDFDYFKDGFDERGKIIEELREKIQELESKIL
ncbi:MAG: hypothetical protein BGO89_13655 [Candidatus Kapaibacterium thiocyanatum]|uniref:Uncharacterized protein n=1 Tax=Candidatus Kapaibacterium thiocyanatum TaxID=1895771 RepID=A0A1M3KVE0_9BACT|nr:MAG: hypothetical protein BGO89_13655 ['Candidatus Kapabacteria' thiocyanatum]